MLEALILAVSGVVTFLFFLYGYNCFYILVKARRYSIPEPAGSLVEKPTVAIHLPIYNEKYVARRLLEACASVADEYGKRLVRIMVLDDSDDDTVDEVDRIAAELKSKGVLVEVIRRDRREGFKAGALQNALLSTGEKYVAVFDSDFVPSRGFLSRVIPHLEADENLGVVQTRWSHLNRGYNTLTKAVSIGIDGHFFVEQPGRFQAGCFLNFNGSGGVIRVEALKEAGGWQSDTLAEDLDMSYRLQIAGYRILYLKDMAVPGEVPPTLSSFKRQQGRWASGSLRTASKLLPIIARDRRLSLKQKFEAFLHLTYYVVHPLILLSFLLASLAAIMNLDAISPKISQQTMDSLSGGSGMSGLLYAPWVLLGVAIGVCWLAVWLYYVATLREQKLGVLRNVPSLILLGFLGYGISISNTLQAAKPFLGIKSPFMRTPKYGVRVDGDTWRDKKYQIPVNLTSLLEAGGIALGVVSIMYAINYGNWGIVPILLLYTLSYGFVSVSTFLQSVWSRSEKADRVQRT